MELTARKFIRTQQEDPATSRNSAAQRIVKRANNGRSAARRRGVHMDRKPKLTELQPHVARERVAKGESARAIARNWGTRTRAITTASRASTGRAVHLPLLTLIHRLDYRVAGGDTEFPGRHASATSGSFFSWLHRRSGPVIISMRPFITLPPRRTPMNPAAQLRKAVSTGATQKVSMIQIPINHDSEIHDLLARLQVIRKAAPFD